MLSVCVCVFMRCCFFSYQFYCFQCCGLRLAHEVQHQHRYANVLEAVMLVSPLLIAKKRKAMSVDQLPVTVIYERRKL